MDEGLARTVEWYRRSKGLRGFMSDALIHAGVAAFFALVVAGVCTGMVRRYALRSQLPDLPNARSSHCGRRRAVAASPSSLR